MAATKERVAFCKECGLWFPPDEAGQPCGSGCLRADDNPRCLRLRLGYICHDCEDAPLFFDKGEYERHRRHNWEDNHD